ncbi:MAG TPA: OsmC family protein [Gemmatimonadaceae bacterium]|nr:OsmC family protein [Gemmatimonadaceae bacterium]
MTDSTGATTRPANAAPADGVEPTTNLAPTGISASRPPKPPSRVTVSWEGEQRMRAAREGGGGEIVLDGASRAGPSPVETLAMALGACVSMDVVDYLAKRRTPPTRYDVDVVADRANAVPARIVAVRMTFRISGAGIDRAHAERAITLAIDKYCSVKESLDPAIPIDWTLELDA